LLLRIVILKNCGSYDLLARWPRRQEDNTLKYITNLPYIVDDSCEYMRREIPIVYCPDKCVKIVLETAKTSPLEDCGKYRICIHMFKFFV
uniref:FZ domain-containing protein n=1 Tax=Rhabditophanes sp. KR3021 TaxID=114890 RepID=A0AC35UH52_9BILA